MSATTADAQICDLDLKGISEGLRAGAFSSVEVTEAYLRRIERHDGVLQSYITVTAERALEQARRADAALARGDRRGPLHGVPIAIKDLVAVAGVKMTGGSRVLGDHVPAEDAFVARQLDEAGAVLLGKLSMHEFAWGYPTREGPFPTGRNPWNVARVPAGSSSGSGVAVAAGLCAGALGSDTGGSIRGPAANCGIVGLKATYGLVSRTGVLPMCWSLDHVGPMTRTVWDTAVMLQAIAGHDPADASTSAIAPPNYTRDLEGGVRGMRLGLPRRYYLDWEGLHADVRSAAVAAFAELERQGARIEEVESRCSTCCPRSGCRWWPRRTTTTARRSASARTSTATSCAPNCTWRAPSPPRTTCVPSGCGPGWPARWRPCWSGSMRWSSPGRPCRPSPLTRFPRT